MSGTNGVAVLKLAADVGSTAQQSVVQWEEPAGRAAGPLLLTVNYNLGSAVPSTQNPNNVQAQQLPAMLNGVAFTGLGVAGAWGNALPTDVTMIGSLLLDIIQGSVHRSVVADLRAGTYQLPPCDSVRVSCRLRRAALGPVVSSGQAVFQSSIAPGQINQALPLTYSDIAVVTSDVAVDVSRRFYAPEGATEYRAYTSQRAGFVSSQNPTWILRGNLVGGGYPFGLSWGPGGMWNSVLGRLNAALTVGSSYVTGVQWRIDL